MAEDEFTLVIDTLKKFGYSTTKPRAKTSNGPDLFAIRDDYVLSVEVKRATTFQKRRAVRVRKVEHNRVNDDLVAIVFPNGYVLLEPMKDHLKSCGKSGERWFTY